MRISALFLALLAISGPVSADIALKPAAELSSPVVFSAPASIPPLAVYDATLTEALAAALSPVGVPWVIAHKSSQVGVPGQDQDIRASLGGVSGSVETVMSAIADAYGVSWRWEGKRVVVSRTNTHTLLVPAGKMVADAVVQSAKGLGATDASYDAALGAVVFTATGETAAKVRDYADHLAREQKQLIYEVYAFQVDLNDDDQMGIAWDKIAWTSGKTSLDLGTKTLGIPGAIAPHIAFNGAKISLDVLMGFLQTQGNVRVVSKPVLQALSGGTAKLRNGTDTTYLKNLVQVRDSLGNVTPSVEQGVVKSGFELALTGRVRDGKVVMQVDLALDELIGLNPTTIGDSQFTLPQTSKREVHSSLTAASGEAAILGGVVIERSEEAKNTLFGLTLSKRTVKKRSELVFYIKPTLAGENAR